MKRFSLKKKIVAGAAVTALVAAIGGGAYAYFTSTGQGTGSATTGSSTAFAVSSTPVTAADLVPDAAIGTGHIDTVSYTVTNNGSGQENLSQVTVQVAGSTGTSPAATPVVFSAGSAPACTKADFSVGGAPVGTTYTIDHSVDPALPDNLAAGASYTGSVSLQMIDNGANQDSCQSVTVPLFFAAS